MIPILGLIAGLLPLVTAVVQSVEGIFGNGNGQKKKEAATTAITDILNIANTVRPTPALQSDELLLGIGQIVDGVVRVMNATGVFKRSA